MVRVVVTLAAALAMAGGAAAQTASPARSSASPTRVLFICDNSVDTRIAFEREHGPMRFMTAEQLQRARTTGEAWRTPRCVSDTELARLRTLRDRPVVIADRR